MNDITLTVSPTIDDYTALQTLVSNGNDPTGFLTHVLALYREQANRHYIYDDEDTEFTCGQATTRIDINYALNAISDLIEPLDYKNSEHHEVMLDIRIKLQELIQTLNTLEATCIV